MVRRWVIRGLFLGLVLLLVGGWEWSARHHALLAYAHGKYRIGIHTTEGTVGESHEWERPSGLPNGWEYGFSKLGETGEYWPVSGSTYRYRFGFGVGQARDSLDGPWYTVEIPYWFLIVIAVGVLLIVWRKTRRRADVRSAFPVEVGVKEERGS